MRGGYSMTPQDLDRLHEALIARPGFETVPRDALAPMAQKGLAHDHVVIEGTGALLRVPRQSQFALPAKENLDYQLAGFARCAAGGHAPRPHGACPPSKAVPMGAAIVDHIEGRPARLPGDLPALAECLASIHTLPVPDPECRPPLADHRNPVAGTLSSSKSRRCSSTRPAGTGTRAA